MSVYQLPVGERSGEPTICQTGVFLAPLLACWTRASENHAKKHPGLPYDFECIDWTHEAVRDFCDEHTHISISQAKEALGYALLALVRLGLSRHETVFVAAIDRATKADTRNRKQSEATS